MATAPYEIQRVYDVIHTSLPSSQLGGIVGDVAHSFGYHLARNELPASDYSVLLPFDRLGRADCASALDIDLGAMEMIAVTRRLLAAAKGRDPRMAAVREFCGTLDGSVTCAYDLAAQSQSMGTWDDSHLWHVHLSFYRKYAEDYAALAGVIGVVIGDDSHTLSATAAPLEDDPMANVKITQAEWDTVLAAARATGGLTRVNYQTMYNNVAQTKQILNSLRGAVNAANTSEAAQLKQLAAAVAAKAGQ